MPSARIDRRSSSRCASSSGRGRRAEDRVGQHPLGEVVDPLEAAPGQGRDLAGPEEPFEGSLAVAPTPPGRLGPAPVREFAGADRSSFRDLPADPVDEIRPLPPEPRDAAVDPLAARGPSHAPAQERVQVEMDQGGLVAPVLEGDAPAAVIGSPRPAATGRKRRGARRGACNGPAPARSPNRSGAAPSAAARGRRGGRSPLRDGARGTPGRRARCDGPGPGTGPGLHGTGLGTKGRDPSWQPAYDILDR